MVTKTPKKKKYRTDVGEFKGERVTKKMLQNPHKQRREIREMLRFCDDLAEGLV